MSDNKSITLKLGGGFGFKVAKTFADGVERFTVTVGEYRDGIEIADTVTWAEATAAMNRFKDEFETAFEALVQVSTLTPVGVHEES